MRQARLAKEDDLFALSLIAGLTIPIPIEATAAGREILARSAQGRVLSGAFEEERVHPFLEDPIRNKGSFAWGNGEFHWRTVDPAVAYFRYSRDAAQFQIYFPDENRVELYPTKLLADWRVLLGSRLKDLATSNRVRVFLGPRVPDGKGVADGRNVLIVRHEKSKGARYIRGVIDVKLGVLREISWQSESAGPVTLRFTEIRTGEKLPTWCHHRLPAHVRREEMGGEKP